MKHTAGTYIEAAAATPKPRRKAWYRRPVPQMLVALVLGAVVGVLFPQAATEFSPLSGIGSMIPLAKLLLIFYASCVLFICIVLGGICAITGVNLWSLVKYLRAELVLAFSTASSEAILPSLLKKLERAGCQKHVVGFVMAVVFVSQACNVPLSLPQELSLIAIFMLTSKGIAGVAGAGFVALAGTLSIYQAVPLAGIVLLLGVDRFMDSMRTVTNVIGNAVATLTIAAWEKARDDAKMRRAFDGDLSVTDEK